MWGNSYKFRQTQPNTLTMSVLPKTSTNYNILFTPNLLTFPTNLRARLAAKKRKKTSKIHVRILKLTHCPAPGLSVALT